MNRFLLLSIVLFWVAQAQATTYYSTQDGEWTDPIWSTKDHSGTGVTLTNLECDFRGSDTVRIIHNIISSCGVLEVGKGGGSSVIILDPAGTFDVTNLALYGGFLIAVNAGTSITVNGNLLMQGNSEMIVDGELLIAGDAELQGASKICGTGLIAITGTLTLGNNATWCSSLPVEWLSFDAKRQANSIVLTWATASETNNVSFAIERSYDAERFQKIATVAGAGTTAMGSEYQYEDKGYALDAQWVYYRIQQTDADGSSSYSDLVAVQLAHSNDQARLYPNPARDQFVIERPIADEAASIRVYDAMGTLIHEQQLEAQAFQTNVYTQSWSSGTYFLVVETPSAAFRRMVVVNR